MSSYAGLYVDSITVDLLRNGVPSEILAVFADRMLRQRKTTTVEHYADPEVADDELVQVYEFVAPGRIIADRLDVLGFDRTLTLAALDRVLEAARSGYARWLAWPGSAEMRARWQQELAQLDGYTGLDWIGDLGTAAHHPDDGNQLTPGSRSWLLNLIEGLDHRFAMRAVLLALPDAEVRLDLTDLVEGGWLNDPPDRLCTEALIALREDAAVHAPIIVLTEGRTDIQVLQPALDLLYPHLTDLIRFMDYAERPEGGAAALVRTVRAFAAAGVVNRVVALFDNDTAATDALRNLNRNELPDGIRVLHYPELELAMDYPTLGPPTADAPTGRLERANVNGRAGSIELYLGRDVLTASNGVVRPVQWRSFVAGVRQYQGEVVDKNALHEAYRAKVEAVRADPGVMASQDWSGLQAILDLIRSAFQ
jgi:HEPN/Toprim N-terminal domain 1